MAEPLPMPEPELPPGQDAMLRLLDTRMACLLVDRPRGDPLRQHLERLRDRLAREPLDAQTLAKVETTVRALARRDTVPLAFPRTRPQALSNRSTPRAGSASVARQRL